MKRRSKRMKGCVGGCQVAAALLRRNKHSAIVGLKHNSEALRFTGVYLSQ